MSKRRDISKKAEIVLNEHKRMVWPLVKEYLNMPQFPLEFRIKEKYKPLQRFHSKLIREYPSRMGKYVRPTLILLTCSALGENKKLALKTAVAMQLSEEWILIHDDFEDQSLLRRGKPTLHREYNNELAVNAGDAIHTVMWKSLMDNLDELGDKTSKMVWEEFYKIMTSTTLSQTVEIKWRLGNKLRITDEDWYFLADRNSSYYSIVGPIRLGAIIAAADRKQIKSLSQFGLELGRSWQMVDDILGVTGNFSGKKQTANDVYEGKRTLLLGHLLRTADSQDRKKVIAILNKSRDKKSRREVEWIVKKMEEYESIDYAKKLAIKHKKNAEKIFYQQLSFLKNVKERKKMEILMNFILERSY
jgi:geranylgeranyl diphosphate synthase type II